YPAVSGFVTFAVKVVNQTSQPVDLHNVKVRYFLMNELASPVASVQYGDVCCPDIDILGHVTAAVVPLSPPAANADAYIEIGFDALAGSLAPKHAVEVEIQLQGSGISNETNDYSYVASATGTQAQWDGCMGPASCAQFRSCVT